MTRRDELGREIAIEESRLATLKAEVEEITVRLITLREHLATEPSLQDVVPPTPHPVIAAMLMKMFKRRLCGYRTIGYARDETPLGLCEIEEQEP